MEPPHQLPEGQVTRQRELRTALDGKLVKLKDLLNSCEGLLPDLVGGTLWEGLPIVCTCRQWEAMRGICQLFYQVCLGGGGRSCVFMAMATTSDQIDCCEL